MGATQPKVPVRLVHPAHVFNETAMGRWAQQRWAWWQRRAAVRGASGAGADSDAASPAGETAEDAALVLFSVEGAVAHVTLNRPRRRNALNLACWTALGEIAAQLAVDRSVRVVVLSGGGTGGGRGTFSAGSDITEFPEARIGAEAARQYNEAYDGALAAWSALPQPVVARLEGFCLGAGLELALTADLRIASEDAQFAIPAVRLGIGISVADARRLIDVVGPARARSILLTGDRLSAARAYEIGLVDEVLPAEALHARVDELVQTLLSNAPRSMTWVKQVVDFAARHPDQPPLPFDVLGTQVFATEDCAEGVTAFLDRRPPAFHGT